MGIVNSLECKLPVDALLYILDFLPWKDRANCFVLSKWTASFSNTEYCWRYLCGRLTIEESLYIPPDLQLFKEDNWKNIFLKYFRGPLRYSISKRNDEFQSSVYVRFRPNVREIDCSIDAVHDTSIDIPLHQRLQMIKAQYNCDNNESLRILFGGVQKNDDPWKHALVSELFQDSSSEQFSASDTLGDTSSIQTSEIRGQLINPKPGVLLLANNTVTMCDPKVGLRSFR